MNPALVGRVLASIMFGRAPVLLREAPGALRVSSQKPRPPARRSVGHDPTRRAHGAALRNALASCHRPINNLRYGFMERSEATRQSRNFFKSKAWIASRRASLAVAMTRFELVQRFPKGVVFGGDCDLPRRTRAARYAAPGAGQWRADWCQGNGTDRWTSSKHHKPHRHGAVSSKPLRKIRSGNGAIAGADNKIAPPETEFAADPLPSTK